MQSSQVVILVSVLFGFGGLLLGFLLGSAWASRRNQPELVSGETEQFSDAEGVEDEAVPAPVGLAKAETGSAPAEIYTCDCMAPLTAGPGQAETRPASAEISTTPEAEAAAVPTAPAAVSQADSPAPASPPEPAPLMPELPAADRPEKPAEKPKSKKPAASLTILDQINDIFRAMYDGSPLAERNIHLVQDPTLGVTVQVGNEKYAGIDSVPDEEIRTALKAAVKKWEEG